MKPKITILILILIGLLMVTGCSSANTATDEPAAAEAPAATQEVEQPTSLPPTDTAIPIPTDTAAPAPTETTAPTPTEAAAAEVYLGDAVTSHGYAVSALSVQDPATPGILYVPEDGYKLVAVEVMVSNISAEAHMVSPMYGTLVDAEGFLYEAELAGVDDQIATVSINPGERAVGKIAFKVPATATPTSIKYAFDFMGYNFIQASLAPAPEGHVAVTVPDFQPAVPTTKLGDVVEGFGYSLTASAVEDPAAAGILYTPKEGYKLVAVEVILGNVSGSEALSVNPLNAFLVDEKGFVYAAELSGRDGQIDVVDVGVGEKVKGWISFTIPADATPTSIKYSTSYLTGNYLISGLAQ